MNLYIIGAKCTFSRKGIIKRHPASPHTRHFLSSVAKKTLIYPQIIPQPDHKLLAAPYLVTPPAMLLWAHKIIQDHSNKHCQRCLAGWGSLDKAVEMTSPGSRQTGNSVGSLRRKRKGVAARLRAAYPIVTLVEREGKSLIRRNSSRLRSPSPKGLFNRVVVVSVCLSVL